MTHAETGRRPTRLFVVSGHSETEAAVSRCIDAIQATDFEVSRGSLAAAVAQAPELDVAVLVAPDDTSVLEPLKQIRVRASELPVVVVGRDDDEGLALRVVATGARGYLVESALTASHLVTTLSLAIGNQRAIRRLRDARSQAARAGRLDDLTGLANRTLFERRLAQAIEVGRRNRTVVAVLYLDLDGFKGLNDRHGHASGDRFLRDAAEAISACVRQSDTAGRLGGDEFGIIVSNLVREADASKVAIQLLRALEELGQTVGVTASIGIASFPRDGLCVEDLLKNGDYAMYQAKAAGRGRYEFFRTRSEHAIDGATGLEARMSRAVAEGRLVLDYQPVVDVARERIVGAEAFLRYEDEEFGLLRPEQFIAVAEQTGAIMPIGEWALRAACQQARQWNEPCPGFRISINCSGRQIQSLHFSRVVKRVLDEARLSPDLLEIEIQERVLAAANDIGMRTLQHLRELGVSIAVDHFGTGPSSLSDLKHLPVDGLKIDRSFMAGVADDSRNDSIAQAIAQLARGLNLGLVADGVETLEQLGRASALGCDRVQGYLFGRPADAARLRDQLRTPGFGLTRFTDEIAR